jgi:hypothetical protein
MIPAGFKAKAHCSCRLLRDSRVLVSLVPVERLRAIGKRPFNIRCPMRVDGPMHVNVDESYRFALLLNQLVWLCDLSCFRVRLGENEPRFLGKADCQQKVVRE